MMEKNEMKSQRTGLVEFFRTWCAYLFLQYELITCTCMFEPWEKVFINSLVLTIFGLVSYSSCVYLPRYLISLFDWLVQMSGTLTTISFDCFGKALIVKSIFSLLRSHKHSGTLMNKQCKSDKFSLGVKKVKQNGSSVEDSKLIICDVQM